MADGPPNLVCPECGEQNSAEALNCRKCGAMLPVRVLSDGGHSQPAAGSQFTLSTLLSVVTLLGVFFALFVSLPGLAIFLAIFSFPAFIRTAIVARRRKQIGRPMATETKVAAFFGSLMTAITIAVVVVVASVGTFCTICLASGKEEVIPVALLVAGTITLPILIALGKWVRNRYRRDTLSDRHPPGGPVA